MINEENLKEIAIYIGKWSLMFIGIVILVIGISQAIVGDGSGGIFNSIFGALMMGISAGIFEYNC
jgi:hypothetical protein